MAKDTPRKILTDVKKTVLFHASLGRDSYQKSDAIQSLLDVSFESMAKEQESGDAPIAQASTSQEKQTQKASAKISKKSLVEIRRELGDCTRCSLHEGRTRILFGEGPEDARLFIIGEWPNRVDDAEGVFFGQEQGELLQKMLQAIGVDMEETYRTNIVKCRASEEKPPQRDNIVTCRPFLMHQIKAVSPKAILTMGPLAAEVMLNTNKQLIHLRGRVHKFKDIPLIPTFHPSYLLKTPEMKQGAWVDLQLTQRELGL